MVRTFVFAAAATLMSLASAQAANIVFIDSYHAEYAWSAGITRGVEQGVAGSGHTLHIHRMDTKRNTSEDFKKQAAKKAYDFIKEKKADVVIACDDNASQYLIAPYLNKEGIPAVFCGVNWDASGYGFPTPTVTGMIEVSAVDELLELLKPHAKGDRVRFLGPDVTSARKAIDNMIKVFGGEFNFVESIYVSHMSEFEEKYKAAQDGADIVIFEANAGIKDWDDAKAEEIILANTTVPTGGMHGFMTPFVMMSFAKVPEEQGLFAADAAIKILNGTKVSDIPIARNKEGALMINAKIATALGVELPAELVSMAEKVIE